MAADDNRMEKIQGIMLIVTINSGGRFKRKDDLDKLKSRNGK